MHVPLLDLTKSGEKLADRQFYRTHHMIIYFVTFLVALFVVITASCIFIEFVAAFTKKCIDVVADQLTSDCATMSIPRAPQTEPRMLKHQLLDTTCPFTSDPPDELSAEEETLSSRSRCSPCGICCNPLTMGDLTRRFPCHHRFHARCVDRACITDEDCEKPVRVAGAYLQCPVCSHVIFPTPDLITNCVISVE